MAGVDARAVGDAVTRSSLDANAELTARRLHPLLNSSPPHLSIFISRQKIGHAGASEADGLDRHVLISDAFADSHRRQHRFFKIPCD